MSAVPTSSPPVPGFRKLPILGTIGSAFGMFAARPLVFLGLSAIVIAPNVLHVAFAGFEKAQALDPAAVVALIAYVLLLFLIQTAMVTLAVRSGEGTRVTVADALQVGLRRYLPMLGASILSMLAVYLGMFLLLVPGLIAACAFAVVIPACALEQTGVVDSLRRSAALTKGARWRILAIYLILFTPLIAFGIANAILGARSGSLTTFGVLNQIFSLVWTPLSILIGAAIYVGLRRLKETIGVSSVFD